MRYTTMFHTTDASPYTKFWRVTVYLTDNVTIRQILVCVTHLPKGLGLRTWMGLLTFEETTALQDSHTGYSARPLRLGSQVGVYRGLLNVIGQKGNICPSVSSIYGHRPRLLIAIRITCAFGA